MTEKCVECPQPDIGGELCLVEGKNGRFLGYKRDILIENLSERENTMFVCIRCQGIMRQPCLSSGGVQFCSCCRKEGERTHPNIHVSNTVLSFKCSCPLIARGCGWVGALGGCQDHLDTCGYVHEKCKLRCGAVLQRNELKVHEKENCPQHIVECKHCLRDFKSCQLPTHLDVCPRMEVPCELKCGKKLFRENMAQHLEQECGLVVETCKLGCGVELTRDELKIHVTDTCVQRKIPCEHCREDFKSCELPNHLDVCPKMKVSCELKCVKKLFRENMAQHLEQECGLVVETCKLGCGVELTRDELKIHVTDTCVQRKIPCEHCREDFKSCELPNHLDVCPKMKVSCELKCVKKLFRENMAQHLEQECGLVVETCKLGCGVELTRDELKIHVTDTCVQRKIPCKHCREDFKSCELPNHLDVCPRMKVSCELGCGVIMCRKDLTQHLEVECPEKELECQFAKYKCVGLIKRKDMSKHLEEKRVEHLELKQMEESEIIAKQSVMIETMSQEIKSLNKKVQVKQHLNHIPIKLEFRITELPDSTKFSVNSGIKKRFIIAGYHFELDVRTNFFGSFEIIIRPLTGWYYGKLKWPFKAEFITYLNSQSKSTYSRNFKSEVIVVEREDFNSDSNISFNLPTNSELLYMGMCHDDVVDIVVEIYVIFL